MPFVGIGVSRVRSTGIGCTQLRPIAIAWGRLLGPTGVWGGMEDAMDRGSLESWLGMLGQCVSACGCFFLVPAHPRYSLINGHF